MNADRQHLDDVIRDAVEEHAAALATDIPEFGALVAVRHRRARRMLAAATVAVALVGIGGVVVATNRTEAPLAAGRSPSPSSETTTVSLPSTTATAPPVATPPVATMPVEFSCTDPIGEDQLGRQLFGACEPKIDERDGDYACLGRIGTEDGFVIFSSCEPVGQLGPIPGTDEGAPFDNADALRGRSTIYVVQPGDYGIKIASEFCVSFSDLEAMNGWTDASREFPGVGNEILIPNGYDESGCELGSYTITEDDRTRIGVADRFCISVQALDTANIETDGYDGFFPGLMIIIPPTSVSSC